MEYDRKSVFKQKQKEKALHLVKPKKISKFNF